MAQFANASGIAGTSPGLQNAAGMAGNIANSGTGAIATVLASSPNGGETKALDTFNSLANMIAACIETPADCAALFAAAAAPGGAASANMWVANSGLIELPCPTVDDLGTLGGSLSLLDPDGNRLSPTAFTGGGLVLPWGITTDGDDNVWVANFAGQRLSHFCGLRTDTCPPGASTGDAISPATTGYSFGGLVRVTAVAVDQAGNVWLANNWKEIPVQTNPGGFQIVAYVGLAAPVDIPAPIARPTTPAAPVATPVVAAPNFTG